MNFPRLMFFSLILMLSAVCLTAQTTLTATPASVTATQNGSITPAPQVIQLRSDNTVNYTAQFVNTTPAQTVNWAQPTPLSGSVNSSGPDIYVFFTPGLNPGVYSGNLVITATGATNSPLTIPMTLTVNLPSPLSVNQAALSFTATVGSSTPPQAQTLQISTTLGSTVGYSITPSVPWITANPLSGFVAASGSSLATVSVSVNPALAGTTANTYSGSLKISPVGVVGGDVNIPVTLTLAAPPQVQADQTAVIFNYQTTKAAPGRVTLNITSTGAALTYQIGVTYATIPGWLVVQPSPGTTPGTVNIDVTDLANKAPGQYTATITIFAPGSSNTTLNIPVALNVSQFPFLAASPATVSLTTPFGAVPMGSQTIHVTTTSGDPSNFTASIEGNATWLQVLPASGATPADVVASLAPAAASLAPGTYNSAVLITSATSGIGQIRVPVSLTVSNTPTLLADPREMTFVYQTGRPLPSFKQLNVSSSGQPVTFNAATMASWLSVSPASATTGSAGQPATALYVSANPTGLTTGENTAEIRLTQTGQSTPQVAIPVKLQVSDSPLISVDPGSVSFAMTPGGASLDSKNIGLQSTDAVNQVDFRVTPTTTSCGSGWLAVTQLTGRTPLNLTVAVISTGLTPGSVCQGTIALSYSSGNATVTQNIPVTLTLSSGVNISVTPGTLTFTQAQGAAAPAAQTLTLAVTPTGQNTSYSATASTDNGGGWLKVDPSGGSTVGPVKVSVDATNLVKGQYTGTVTIVAPGAANSPQRVQVTLNVTDAQTIAVAANSATFSYTIGAGLPANQTINVTSSGGAVNFTATATANNGGNNWLKATASSGGTTPGSVTISVDPTVLAAGQYTGTVSIASPNAGNSPQTIAVTLNVAARPVGSVTRVVNGGSFQPGPVSPGEIITIFGTNLGPVTGVSATGAGNLIETRVGEVRVLFDGIPAPVLFARTDQVNTIVPYDVYGRTTTRVQIEFQGVVSNTIELNVAPAAPGIFPNSISPNASTQGAILNQDGSINGALRPAAKGSVIVIYATGEGQTTPGGVNGRIISPDNSRNDWTKPLAGTPQVFIDGVQAEVFYGGSAPGLVSGALQINARVPATVRSGNVSVVVRIANVNSQENVTVAVQ